MIHTVIKKGSYQDSVVLMLLTNQISAMDGVNKVSIMMATPANKDIFRAGGLDSDELEAAGANDMAVLVDTEDAAILEVILAKTEEFLKNQAAKVGKKGGENIATSWEQALEKLPDANLAVLSVPGVYAAGVADRALDENLNVFIFSDNVSAEDEARLKCKAHEKGLVVMGPDCGTGILQSVPVAFTNHVTPGRIGIVGASGTGIQELCSIIDHLGEGVTNAIGTGGRDLSAAVGGITMLDALGAMEEDAATDVVVVVSKPPAKEVRDTVVGRLRAYQKPVVTLFLGERPEIHEENFYHASTLDEAARIAVALVRGQAVTPDDYRPQVPALSQVGGTIKAYYSGGTLASEAAMMIQNTLQLPAGNGKHEGGYMLSAEGHMVVDLGDDQYTQGRPHPMIDPTRRTEVMLGALDDPKTAVVLFDVVLGYGSHEDPAGALVPCVSALREKANAQGRELAFVASICGTRRDYQGYDSQRQKLEDAGVLVLESNKRAVETALHLIGHTFTEPVKPVEARVHAGGAPAAPVSPALRALIASKPRIINIGLRGFSKVLQDFHCDVVQYDWTPPAGGDLALIQVLSFLRGYQFSE